MNTIVQLAMTVSLVALLAGCGTLGAAPQPAPQPAPVATAPMVHHHAVIETTPEQDQAAADRADKRADQLAARAKKARQDRTEVKKEDKAFRADTTNAAKADAAEQAKVKADKADAAAIKANDDIAKDKTPAK